MPLIRRLARIALVPAIAALLALSGCGTSKVVREGGSAGTRSSTPRPGQTVTVRRGDNLYRLATNNGISALDLAMWNGIAAPYTIYPGQTLRLYPSAGTRTSTAARGRASGTSRPVTDSRGRTVQPTQAPPQPTGAAPLKSAVAWRWPPASVRSRCCSHWCRGRARLNPSRCQAQRSLRRRPTART